MIGLLTDGDTPMTAMPPKAKPTTVVDVPATGQLSDYSGSKSPAFTNSLLNAVINTAWLPNGGDREVKSRQVQITLGALRSFKPTDAIEGMLAAQAVAMHQGAMECLSCPRFFWTPICPRRARNDDAQHDADRSS
jgi:hypothetical protein